MPDGPTVSSPSTSRPRPCAGSSRPTATPADEVPLACRCTWWAPTEDEALHVAHDQWRSNVLGPPVAWDTETVEAFDLIGESVTPDQVRDAVLVSADLGRHAQWLQDYVDMGWDEIYVHFVGQHQTPFIEAFGTSVLPRSSPSGPVPQSDSPQGSREVVR